MWVAIKLRDKGLVQNIDYVQAKCGNIYRLKKIVFDVVTIAFGLRNVTR